MATQSAILKAKIEDVITELLVKTNVDNVYVDDSTTLADKLTEMVTAINARAKSTDVTTAISTAIDDLIDGAPDTYNTLKEISDYLTTHQDEYTALVAEVATKAPKDVATTSAAGLMSASDKSKLDAITASADAVSVTQTLKSGTEVGKVTVNGSATTLYAPTNTDTHYTSKNVVGGTSATSNTTTALTNGNVYLNSVENGTVTSTHKITGSGATTVATDTSGNIVVSSTNTTYAAATTSAAGLMSTADKTKLDGITASADAVSVTQTLTSGTEVGKVTVNGTATTLYAPTNTDTHYTTGLKVGASSTATANAAATNGNVYMNVLDNTTVRDSHNIVGSGATTVASDANGKITISSTNTTYSVATTSAAGLMSASDKSKLDAISTGANKTTVDSALSSSSTNPVQNKVINTALASKATIYVDSTEPTDMTSADLWIQLV